MLINLNETIALQIAFIKKLEARPMPNYKTAAYFIWNSEIRDAYWSKRMLIAKRDEQISPHAIW
jgi:hypothetical protein